MEDTMTQPNTWESLRNVVGPLLLVTAALVLIMGVLRQVRSRSRKGTPPPQPTESEAIVAALRQPQTPQSPLEPPKPLPVDVAASLPSGDDEPRPQGKLENS
jgi:hypothetical protein